MLNVSTDRTAALSTNHYLIRVDLRVKRGAGHRRRETIVGQNRDPTEEQKEDYKERIEKKMEEEENTEEEKEVEEEWKELKETIRKAWEDTIPKPEGRPNKEWISQQTWRMVKEREEARKAEQEERVAELHREIKKSARKDKKEWISQKLMDSQRAPAEREKWVWIKRTKKEAYSAKALKLKGEQGKVVNALKKADAFAKYLTERHWAKVEEGRNEPTEERPVVETPAEVGVEDITVGELKRAIGATKCRKQQGQMRYQQRPSNGWETRHTGDWQGFFHR